MFLYYALSILTGALIAVMIVINGGLTEAYGVFPATVIIHAVGLVFLFLCAIVKRERPFADKKLPLYYYSGGAIGVATVTFNNFAFGRISVSAILALCLLGQSVTSIIIDQFGWLQMPKSRFTPKKLSGIAVIVLGIFLMMSRSSGGGQIILASVVSFLSGVTIVVARTTNAGLALKTSILKSTFYNYAVGLVVSAAVLLAATGGFRLSLPQAAPFRPWIYLGGVIGVFMIMLSNLTVSKIPSFPMTLLLFIGQVFTGILLDMLLTNVFSWQLMLGSLCVTAGLVVNMLIENPKKE